MKRDANLFLMGLLVLTVVSMVGLAVYFQSEYKSLAVEYNSALENFRRRTQNWTKRYRR